MTQHLRPLFYSLLFAVFASGCAGKLDNSLENATGSSVGSDGDSDFFSFDTDAKTIEVVIDDAWLKMTSAPGATLPASQKCHVKMGKILKLEDNPIQKGRHMKIRLTTASAQEVGCGKQDWYVYTASYDDASDSTDATAGAGEMPKTTASSGSGVYPFKKVSSYSITGEARQFGASRDGGARKHAGVDLIASGGTPIHAIEDGTIIQSYLFYKDTYALEVKSGQKIYRYCEHYKTASGVREGDTVKKGQVLTYLGLMLHFEMYDGSKSGSLTVRENTGFERRLDLKNPTSFIKSLENNLP